MQGCDNIQPMDRADAPDVYNLSSDSQLLWVAFLFQESDMSNIFFILAAICFGLGAAKVGGRVEWTNAGFCCLTIALWLV